MVDGGVTGGLIRFLLYGMVGWCAEIVWTSGTGLATAVVAPALAPWRTRRSLDPRLAGHTYLWMLPIYGLGGLGFERAHGVVAAWPWPARGLVYMASCFAVEWAAGWSLERLIGVVPWDYSSRTRWHVRGIIRVDYAPVWFAFGLMLEWVERCVCAVAPVLRRLG